MQTILGANGVIGRELSAQLPRYWTRIRQQQQDGAGVRTHSHRVSRRHRGNPGRLSQRQPRAGATNFKTLSIRCAL